MAKIKLFFILLLISNGLFAQTNRYMVFFSDKANSPYSVSEPLTFLSQMAIDRRIKSGVAITEQDLPVNPSYVQGVKDLGVAVFFTSKWFNAALAQTDESNISAIETLNYVDSVILVAPNQRLINGRKNRIKSKERSAGENDSQLSMLGVTTLHNDGLNGEGVKLAFFDAGFLGVNDKPAFQHIFTNNQVSATLNIVDNSSDVYTSSNHGTRVISTVAAKIEGEYFGVATAAEFLLYVTEDESSEHRIEEYNWLIAAEKADSAGADIIASSVGYNTFDSPSTSYTYEDMDGETTIVTRAANIASEKGILVVTSAGNSGNDSWKFITAPADAKNIISVGSVNADGSRSNFSSFGPTADGRIKPEVVALGNGTSVVTSSGAVVTGSGTSFAAPQVAGLAALILQMNPTFTNLQLRDFILSLGTNVDNPNNEIGYGIPNYNTVLQIDEALNMDPVVFPNPIDQGVLNVKLKSFSAEGYYEIFNAAGQMVSTGTLKVNASDNTATIDVSNLAKGLFLLQINFSKQSYNHRIIKH